MEDRLKDIEVISNHVDLLIELANEIISKKIEYDSDDSFAFMSLCFLTKQIEHCRSIRFLINAEQFSDTMLIARTMVEGLVIIAWCYKNPKYYGDKWCNYASVCDYKLFLQKDKKEIKKDLELDIIDRLEKYGKSFMTNKARKNSLKNKPLPDFPYSHTWLVNENGDEIKISTLFEETDPHLRKIYSDMSGWIHWNIGSVGQNINRSSNRVEIKANNSRDGALSLAAAFQALYGLLEIVDYYLKLDFKNKLEIIRKEFLYAVDSLRRN